MKVYTVRDLVRRSTVVYVELGPVPDKPGWRYFQTLMHPDGVGPGVMEVEPDAEPPIWFRVNDEIAGALAEALSPTPEVTGRHLDDAIMVRDRLLAIVEAS